MWCLGGIETCSLVDARTVFGNCSGISGKLLFVTMSALRCRKTTLRLGIKASRYLPP